MGRARENFNSVYFKDETGAQMSFANGSYAIRGNYGTAEYNRRRHDPRSPLMIGHLCDDDVVKERPVKSLRSTQHTLF
mgnify:CR=1 FL=1